MATPAESGSNEDPEERPVAKMRSADQKRGSEN